MNDQPFKSGIELQVSGWRDLHLKYLVMDINGTLSTDGFLITGVAERVAKLQPLLDCHVISGDTFGTAEDIARELGCDLHRLGGIDQAKHKEALILKLGAESVVAIGNGSNDELMLRRAGLGMCIVGREGASGAALAMADLSFPSVTDALDGLLRPMRLIAALRR